MKVRARTKWVWTQLAQDSFDGRYTKGKKREAGKPISDKPEEAEVTWLLRGYVCDAEDYIPADGQMDLFEILEG